MRAPSKYGNRRTVVDNISFASAKEARRYAELKLLERAGEITDLRLQPRFPLKVNDALVTTYVADFAYRHTFHGAIMAQEIIEDAKGFRTDVFIIKSRLFAAIHGFQIREV